MSTSAEGALKAAVYTALTGSAGLMAVVTGVFDFVPEGQAAPYVEIGEVVSVPFDTKNSDGQEHTITLHAWSEYQGYKQAQDILALMYEALHNQPITVTGHQLILCQFDFSTVLKDPDGVTHHGVMRFRALTEDN